MADRLEKDKDGNIIEETIPGAIENGDVVVLTSGSLWDKKNDEEFWPDGTKK